MNQIVAQAAAASKEERRQDQAPAGVTVSALTTEMFDAARRLRKDGTPAERYRAEQTLDSLIAGELAYELAFHHHEALFDRLPRAQRDELVHASSLGLRSLRPAWLEMAADIAIDDVVQHLRNIGLLHRPFGPEAEHETRLQRAKAATVVAVVRAAIFGVLTGARDVGFTRWCAAHRLPPAPSSSTMSQGGGQ